MCDNFRLRKAFVSTAALYGYGALNAFLYASLMPLWEGFDEPFHYASVATISRQARLPVLNKTGVSEEIRASLDLAPASHVVRQNLPRVTTFEEFFALDAGERSRRVAALAAIPPSLGDRIPDDGTNYEAQQAPLAYLVLAPFDRLWAGLPLPRRVWLLRLICGLCGVLAVGWATLALARRLGLAPPFARAAVFLVLSSQMLYAATAHVANDWLAVALMPVLLLAAVTYRQSPSAGAALWMGLALAAGLLSKAYFLALVPLPLALVWRDRRGAAALLAPVLLLAAPWYGRNWCVYGNITGLMDAVARPRLGDVAGAAASIPWGTAAAASARRALWTANNSFDSFSYGTLNIMLALGLAGAACYAVAAWKKRPGRGEGILLAGCLLFLAVLVYSTCVLYLLFGDTALGGAPWYAPAIFAPVFVLLACGLERSGAAGRVLMAAMLAGWAYVLAATWWLKLIPLYGGYTGRVRLAALTTWYLEDRHLLASTALAPPAIVMILAGLSALAALALAAGLGAGLWSVRRGRTVPATIPR